ncbi:hypothetical protein PTKIN_Ptkin12aG0141700 [Pterospermum kingtungense]
MAPAGDQNGLKTSKKRKRSAMDVLRLALYMLGWKSSKSKSKSIEVNAVSSFSWRGLLCSMRPMHLQSDESPRSHIQTIPAIMSEPEPIPVGDQQKEEPITPPLSPKEYVSAHSPNFSISSYGSESDLSHYASPSNQEIHVSEDDYEYDDDGGDEMIDAKAEEFIAYFYEQMRLQNLN